MSRTDPILPPEPGGPIPPQIAPEAGRALGAVCGVLLSLVAFSERFEFTQSVLLMLLLLALFGLFARTAQPISLKERLLTGGVVAVVFLAFMGLRGLLAALQGNGTIGISGVQVSLVDGFLLYLGLGAVFFLFIWAGAIFALDLRPITGNLLKALLDGNAKKVADVERVLRAFGILLLTVAGLIIVASNILQNPAVDYSKIPTIFKTNPK